MNVVLIAFKASISTSCISICSVIWALHSPSIMLLISWWKWLIPSYGCRGPLRASIHHSSTDRLCVRIWVPQWVNPAVTDLIRDVERKVWWHFLIPQQIDNAGAISAYSITFWPFLLVHSSAHSRIMAVAPLVAFHFADRWCSKLIQTIDLHTLAHGYNSLARVLVSLWYLWIGMDVVLFNGLRRVDTDDMFGCHLTEVAH